MYKFTKCKTILANTYSLRAITRIITTHNVSANLTSNFAIKCSGSRIRNVAFCDQDETNTSVVRLKLEQIPELNCGQQYKVVIDRPAILEDGDNYSQLADDGSYNGSSVMFTVYNSNCSVMNYNITSTIDINSNTNSTITIKGGKLFANTLIDIYSKHTNLNKQLLNAYYTNMSCAISGNVNRQGIINFNSTNIETVNPYNNYSLYGWGNNTYGQLGIGDNINKETPNQIGSSTWDTIRSFGDTVYAIKSDGTLWVWGSGYSNIPTQVGTDKWSQIFWYLGYLRAIKSDGTLWYWDSSTSYVPTLISSAVAWKKIYGEYATKIDGTLWYWSSNTYIQVGTATNWDEFYYDISTDSSLKYALKSDKTLWSISGTTATQIGSSTWNKIYYRNSVFHGIRTDGTLWAMGRNNNGQLGDGTIVDKSSLVKIGTYSTWTQIWMDDEGLCRFGRNTEQGLCAWGNNGYGRLGNGNTTQQNSPVSLSGTGIANATNIIVSRGSCFAYGQNDSNLSSAYRNTYSNAIHFDYNRDIYLKLYVWGYNGLGQLGLGDSVNRSNPTQLSANGTWKKILPHKDYTFGIKNDGTLWAWGSGKLGIGTGPAQTSNIPVQVGTNNNFYDIVSEPTFVNDSIIALTT